MQTSWSTCLSLNISSLDFMYLSLTLFFVRRTLNESIHSQIAHSLCFTVVMKNKVLLVVESMEKIYPFFKCLLVITGSTLSVKCNYEYKIIEKQLFLLFCQKQINKELNVPCMQKISDSLLLSC